MIQASRRRMQYEIGDVEHWANFEVWYCPTNDFVGERQVELISVNLERSLPFLKVEIDEAFLEDISDAVLCLIRRTMNLNL